jgi:hypothetical protein
MSRTFGAIQGFHEGASFPNRRQLADSGVHRRVWRL